MEGERVETIRAAIEAFKLPLHYVLTFRGERIARMQVFTPSEDACRAAGLLD
jgi:hypothetical protein